MTPEKDRESAADDGERTEGADAGTTRDETEHSDAGAGSASGAAASASGEPGESETAPGEGRAKAANGYDAAADDPSAPPDGGSEAEPSVEERLAAAEALAAAHWDRVVRLQAEMENQRKRAQRDVGNARKFALEGIAEDLLPVKDSLELGIRAASGEEASLASLVEGSQLTLKMLAQVLEKHAIVEIDPEGEKFDPEFHQAMSMQEVEGVAPNTVTGVMQKGYTLNERLIRPALVMVSK